MSELSAEQIKATLETAWVGQQVVYHPTLESTNDEAKRLAEAGMPNGTLVIAEHQTAGRGRLDRQWWSPPGSNLLLSLIFRPAFLAPYQAQRLTMICSLAICDAITQVTGLVAAVKWPNDVLVGGRKVCGLLAELTIARGQLDYVIVGMGINVNVDFKDDDVPAFASPPTSLKTETGQQVSRLAVLGTLLRRVESRYEQLRTGTPPHDEWQARLVTVGQAVRVTMPNRSLTGLAIGVDANGALLVRQTDGEVERVLAGDVTLRMEDKS